MERFDDFDAQSGHTVGTTWGLHVWDAYIDRHCYGSLKVGVLMGVDPGFVEL